MEMSRASGEDPSPRPGLSLGPTCCFGEKKKNWGKDKEFYEFMNCINFVA